MTMQRMHGYADCARCDGVGQFRLGGGDEPYYYTDCRGCKGTGAMHIDTEGNLRPGPPGFAPAAVSHTPSTPRKLFSERA